MTEKASRTASALKRAAKWFENSVTAITAVMTCVALIGTILLINKEACFFTCKNTENPCALGRLVLCTPIACGMIILGSVALVLLWRFLFGLIDKTSAKKLPYISYGLLALFTLICFVMAVCINATPENDSRIIQQMALKMAESDTFHIDMTEAYFQNYSNNDLLTLLTSAFFRALKCFGITDFSHACIMMNALFISLGELFAFIGVRLFFGDKRACRYVMLSVMQPTVYLTVAWPYSNTVCLPFMCGLFMLAAMFYRSKSVAARCFIGAAAGAVASIGYYIRPVVMIEAVALAICVGLYIIRDKSRAKRLLSGLIATAIVGGVVFVSAGIIINDLGGGTSRNFPVTHWIMMGLHNDGLYNKADANFTRSFKTGDEKNRADTEKIKEYIGKIGVFGLPKHLAAKQIITWSDGGGNYIFRMKCVKSSNIVTCAVCGGGRSIIMLYCQMYRAAILLSAVSAMILFIRRKLTLKEFFAILTVFGGMLFYLIWEAKESYSIPFLFMLAVLATAAIERLSERELKPPSKRNRG